MNKKLLFVGISLLIASLLLSGCAGVPYEEYGDVVAEKQAAEAEITSLNSELNSVKEELADTKIELQAMQLNLDEASNEYDELEANYEDASNELTQIKETCPPRWFSTRRELEDWLLSNDVSEKPDTTYVEDTLRRGLEIHEDALDDGYIIFLNFDPDDAGEWFIAECITVVQGDLYAWNPNNDDIYNLSSMFWLPPID